MKPLILSVRKVGKGADAAHDLYAMQDACFPHDTPAEISRGHWWVAYDDDEPVGFGSYCPSIKFDNAVYISRIGVIASHRGCGIAQRVIQVMLAHAKRQGYRLAVTDTTDNPASANSLIACGFRLFAPDEPWSFKTAIYLRKSL